jgi:hypothetical protein
MHPETMRLLAQLRQNALLEEARGERLAAIARGRRRGRSAAHSSDRAWPRFVGGVVTGFGAWLAGRRIESESDLSQAPSRGGDTITLCD